MHGYPARLGFGMTLTKYHANAIRPVTGKKNPIHADLKLIPLILPVFGHRVKKLFLLFDFMPTPGV